MKHAGEAALDALEGVLKQVRKYESLVERKRGIFYVKSTAFLHFHEDPSGLFADLRVGTRWERFPVSTKGEQRVFLAKLASLEVKGPTTR